MSSGTAAWSTGTVVDGRYRVEALLGEGGYGAVYRATQLTLGRAVALKTLRAELTTPEALARFEQEAALAQQLQHPNTVRLLDFGRSAEGAPFLVFELLQGRTLDAAIREGGPFTDARVARLAAQLLKGLMEAHRLGIVHRDIKPANVFLCDFAGEPEFVKILDFGIAKGAGGRALTQRGEVVGTPGYVAPELLREAQAGPRADLYAVGMVLAEARLGRAIFAGVPWEKLALDLLSDDPLPLPAEALAPPLGAIIARATQKRPEDRYADAAAMLAAVEACTTPAPTPPAPRPPTTPPPAPRRRRWPWVVGAALVLAAGGAAAALYAPFVLDLPTARRAAPAKAPENLWVRAEEQEAVEATINRDAVPDLVTTCKGDQGFSLCGIDGATMRLLWTAPVRGNDIYGVAALVTVVGNTALVIDGGGMVTFHDVRTGAKLSTLRLGQRVRHLCTARSGAPAVWVKTENRERMRIDVEPRSVGATAGPDQVPPCRHRGFSIEALEGIGCEDAVVDGSDGVQLGTSQERTSIHQLVGFTPEASGRSRIVRWKRAVAPDQGLGGTTPSQGPMVELAAGRVFAAYRDLNHTEHVVAISAADGRNLWDMRMPEAVTLLRVTRTRVYVGGYQRLDVLDAATGKPLGMFGKPTPGMR